MNQEDLLNAPLPERWSPRQRLKNTIIIQVVTRAFKALKSIPLRYLYGWIRVLSKLAYLLDVSDRNRAISQLQQGLDISEKDARALTREMFEHLGKVGMEWVHKDRLLEEHPDLQLSALHRALFETALEENKGLIAITGHIGNWELLAQMVAKAGFPVVSVARPTYDLRLTCWVHELRSSQGMKILWRGTSSSPKEILRVFRDNHIWACSSTKIQKFNRLLFLFSTSLPPPHRCRDLGVAKKYTHHYRLAASDPGWLQTSFRKIPLYHQRRPRRGCTRINPSRHRAA